MVPKKAFADNEFIEIFQEKGAKKAAQEDIVAAQVEQRLGSGVTKVRQIS